MPPLLRIFLCCFALFTVPVSGSAQIIDRAAKTPLRKDRELTGWKVKAKGTEVWRSIDTNQSWESVLGDSFDGMATYETALPPIETLHETGRLLLHFDGVATHAVIRLDGAKIGEHLGGWTPFRIDITDRYHPGAVLSVDVDEKVGHNTQGFLPVFIPHFGGIWKPVSLIQTSGPAFLDDLTLFAGGWTDSSLAVKTSVQRPDPSNVALEIGLKELGYDDEKIEWQELSPQGMQVEFRKTRPASDPWTNWSPQTPVRYSFEVLLREKTSQRIVDRYRFQSAIRRVETKGREIYLNGEPLILRGVLNWGYAPPKLCPTSDETWMRRELEFAKERGFNMMKFCLWVPPKRYFELCDEMGILAWMEYPTWHPKLTKEFRAPLVQEYEEFFAYDRNHPSIVLRSLTCETGHSADIDVVRELYDRAHRAIPGAIVEDDSSWIGWHRVHDIYDDHPYGNNHTWNQTLQRLEDHMAQRDPKPLVLGEAIAADTWFSKPEDAPMPKKPHRLLSADQLEPAMQRLESYLGERFDPTSSFSYAMEMRKFQIERYRFQMPRQGYTVSVIRDFPFASMGLIDFFDRPKSSPEDWSWHRDQAIAWETEQDRRSFRTSDPISGKVHFLETRSESGVATIEFGGKQFEWPIIPEPELPNNAPITSARALRQAGMTTLEWTCDPNTLSGDTNEAISKQTFSVRWTEGSRSERPVASNAWNLWLIDTESIIPPSVQGVRHRSAESVRLGDPLDGFFAGAWNSKTPVNRVAVARRLDRELLTWVRNGGKLVLLPDGGVGSLITSDHWFLRGAPAVSCTHVGDAVLASMATELQSMDLGGPVLRSPDYLDEVDSWALLWDNHDIAEVRIHSQCWGAKVGQGAMWVSTMAHSPERGAVCGRWIEQGIKALIDGRFQRALSAETIARFEFDLENPQVELKRKGWAFKPDPKNEGLAKRWHIDVEANAAPEKIEIAKQWDAQGYGGLDGWAWYVQRLAIPVDARYVVFTGVDDHFEVYIDGVLCGGGGDRETKQTAFEQTIAIPLPQDRKETATVAIRVEDWQGAGGVFRPVYLTKQPPPSKPSLLRREIASDAVNGAVQGAVNGID